MSAKMGHSTGEVHTNSAKCPECGKEMTHGVKVPKWTSIWWCSCGFEIPHKEAKRAGLITVTIKKA